MTPFLRIFSLVSFRFVEALDRLQANLTKKPVKGIGINKC